MSVAGLELRQRGDLSEESRRHVAIAGRPSAARRNRRQQRLMALPSLAVAVAAAVVPVPILQGDHPGGVSAAVTGAAAVVVLLAATVGGRARPWWLLSVGLAAYAAGSLVGRPAEQSGVVPSTPSGGEVAWLVAALLVFAGLDRLAHPGSRDLDGTAHIDVTLAAAAVVGVAAVLVAPALLPDGTETDVRVVFVAAVLAAAALVAAAVRLAFTGAAASAPGLALVVGGPALGAATIAAQIDVTIGVDAGRAAAALVGVGAVLIAAAALHPAVRRLEHPVRRRRSTLRRPRALLFLVALAAVPATAVARHLADEPIDGNVVAIACGSLTALALVRLELAGRAERRNAAREATVCDASAALAATDDAEEVRRVALRAIREVTGSAAAAVVWVDVTDRGPTVVRAIGPGGEQSPLETATMQRIARLPDVPNAPARSPGGPGELAVYPVPRRAGARGMVVVEGVGAVPLDLDEALLTICAQAGLALDKVALRRAAPGEDARSGQLLRHNPDAVLVLDRHLRVRYQSPSVLQVTGYPAADLETVGIQRIVWPTDAKHLAGFLDQVLRSPPESVRITEIGLARADGSQVRAEVIGANLLDTPDVEGIVLTLRDVTHRRALEDELRHQAFHDALTGLANRALFRDRVEHALNLAQRSDGPSPAVAFLDLDDFKPVNDTLGHSVGDELLRIVADRIRSCLRSGDTPARLGGDEFAVLLEGAAGDEAVHEVAERILHVLHEPMQVHGHELRVRASIGIAHRMDAETTTDDLLRHADLAMYTAKSSGKGTVVTFDASMQDQLFGRATIRGELERSIEQAEIGVAYQPIVRLATGEVIGFEALARWSHPERGAVEPAEFLPLAEASGAIVALGRHILELSCRQLAVWRRSEGGAGWTMHVNLSLGQVLSAGLVAMVEEAAAAAGVPIDGLVFEISEAVVRADEPRVIQRLELLRSLGARIAIDDVGAGAVPLSALERVPFDVLKLDRRLVAAMGGDEPQVAAVRSAVALVQRTGGDVIAEGVEQLGEAEWLLATGCELGQGFLFSAAADASHLADDLGLPRSA